MEIQRLAVSIRARVNELPKRNTAEIRSLRRRLSAELKAGTAEAMLDLAMLLIEQGIEYRFIAYELIANHPAASQSLKWSRQCRGHYESLQNVMHAR